MFWDLRKLMIFLTGILLSYSLDPANVVLAMNVGGAAYTSTFGFTYTPDSNYYYTGVMATYFDTSSLPIARTINSYIYKSERVAAGIWGYDIPVSIDGTYVLILQFAEIYYTTINSRVFTVKVGDYIVLSNLDLFALAGFNSAYDLFVEFTLSSGSVYISGNLISNAYSSGNLIVRLHPVIQAPKISGIILMRGSCATNDYCNMCYQQICVTCDSINLACISCITNAQAVSGACQCSPNAYWVSSTKTCEKCDNLCSDCSGSLNFICTTCVSPNVLVSNICLRECPYGFGSCTPISTPVIDQNFANYFYGAYGLFTTGTSSSRCYFFTSPEAVDPLPAKNRGLYFYGGSYLQSSSVYVSFNFSLGIWVWILPGSGDILGNSPNNKIAISANGALTIILENRLEATTPITTAALNPSNSGWVYISFVASFSSSTISTTIVPYLNNSPQTSITTTQYIYRDAAGNSIYLGQNSLSKFVGYIYQFTLWNVAVSNFNTQYSDQICGSGAVASCLWACSLTQWMNGATITNCDSCPCGCVRSGSCNVCFDPLCSICTGFLTGLCTQCVSNASGSPCACNPGYMLSTDGFSCVPCFNGCATCAGALYYQCSSCLSSYYLLKTMCLTYCPSGYTADSSGHSCTLSSSNPLSISLQNLIQLDMVNGVTVGSSNTNKYPNWEATDPIPSIYRGYYFSGSNYMSLASFTISPYFTLLFWIRMLNNGYLFMKFDGTTKYFTINFISGIPKINILLSDSTPLSITTTPSITTTWHYIAITGGLSSGQTVLTRIINMITVTPVTSTSFAYFKDAGDLCIGKDNTATGGFTGFLWNFKIYNDDTYALQEYISSGCPGCSICPSELICPDNCPFGQFYSSSCVSCTGTCPYGCRSASTCRLCKDKECVTCTTFDGSCTSCIPNAHISGTTCVCNANTFWEQSSDGCQICDNLCNVCQTNKYFMCTSCVATYSIIWNVCLKGCPYGYASPCIAIFTPVINESFNTDFQGVYGIFTTGISATSFQFFNTPEAVDPIPAKKRGLYFNGSQYLISNVNIYLSHSFSMGFWTYVISSGDILTNSRIAVDSSGSIKIPLESPSEITSMQTILGSSFTTWKYLSFTCSFTSSTAAITTVTIYLNNVSGTSSTFNALIYRDLANQKITLGGSSTSYFTGFMYKYQLWNVAIVDFTTQLNEICGSGLLATCLWACPLNKYKFSTTCQNCESTCTLGCTRSGSCNICDDPLCSICTGFDPNKCTNCVLNASGSPCKCNIGWYVSSDGFSCVPCFTGCASCTGLLYYQCSSCSSGYYLLKALCLTYCPSGYTADTSTNSCILTTSNPLDISLQNLIQLDTVNGVSVGLSNSNKYPSWETTDPIPSIYRGYYFSGANYMSLTSFIMSPYFSLLVWVKPLADGYLFMKFDGTTIFSYFNFSSGNHKMNILLSDLTTIYASTSSILYSGWHYIAFTGDLPSGKTALYLSIDGVYISASLSSSFAYMKDNGSLYIGKDSTLSGGFTGFLWSFKIYNDNTYALQEWITSGCPGCAACPSELKCPDNCPFGQFYSSSCVSCVGSCPYGCRSALTCRLCKDKECLACTTFDGPCTSCIANASISGTTCICNSNTFWDQSLDGCAICDNLCSQCQTNKYFLCLSCGPSYHLLYNACLRDCPYGYSSPCTAVFTPVIDASFIGNFQGTYGIFTTGTSATSFQFFNSPESSDPIPAKQRGLYFSGNQYLISNVSIYLSYSFSMGFWINVIASGHVLSNSQIILDSSGSILITLESPSETTSSETLSNTPFTMWKYLSFTCSFSNSSVSTTLIIYLNNVSKASATFNKLIYRDQTNQKIKIGGSLSSYFTGFIYKYHLWNVAVFDFSAQLNEICGSGLLAACLWTCDINKYWYSAACTNCDSSCNLGCTRSRSCNICDDPLCSVCTGFDANKCTMCVSNASGTPCVCNSGYIVSSDGFSCLACFTGCSLCSSTDYYQCAACYSSYFLLNILCDSQCPSGYSQNIATNKCDLVDSLVIDLELDDYIVLDTLYGFNVGNNNTNIYPAFDVNDPIPAINRGYYFTGQSYMSSSLVFSPYFSIMLWVKVIEQGILIEKYDGATQYLVIKIDENGNQNLHLLLRDGSSLNAIATQNLLSDWHYLSFSGKINGNGAYSSNIYADSALLMASTSASKTYLRDSISGVLMIGFDKSSGIGFKGFLWNLKIYNDETYVNNGWTSATCTTNVCPNCPSGVFCPSSCSLTNYPGSSLCNSCKASCFNGCRSDLTCRLCREKECYSCKSFSKKCISCIKNAGFVGDSCQCNQNALWNENTETCDLCPTGWLENKVCLSTFNATLTVNPNNTLILSFSDGLKQNLTNEQIMIQIQNHTIPSWSITYISNKEFLISCDFGRKSLQKAVVSLYFNDSEHIESISGSVLLEKYLSGTLYESEFESDEIAGIKNQVSAGIKILVGSGVILSIFSLNPSSLWTMINTIQLLAYIPYASYPITEKISVFFKSMNNFNIVPNLFLFFIDENESNAPYDRARNYGYDSYLILANIGNDATALCGIIVAIPLVYYFSKCSQRYIGKKFQKIFNEYKFSTFLRFIIVSYLEFGFAATVGILSTDNFKIFESTLESTNYFLCWICIVTII
ncbi:unnamed protein product [Blepharisma stoltei]|uniref:TNFR-Cys domain-containing protein n=1 Tax=Blepharisma stoltei TaxID=1481888 RepID=A0AAU9KF60_9CILI|nr:unnamed protein product [Blepharisma stoltei]